MFSANLIAVLRRRLLPAVGAATLALPASLLAQGYGIPSRPSFAAFHGGALPLNAPTFSGSWSAVPVFPNVTFINALGICELPGQAANDRRMVVWEREGRVYSVPKNPAAVNADKLLMLDITAQCQGWDDSGLLALAFHPNFGSGPTNNRHVFIYYTYVTPGTVTGSATARPSTFKPCRDRLARFTVNLDGTIDASSETIFIDQVSASIWHNGGGMFFHPDNGFLYLTNGDDAQSTVNTQRIDRGLYSGVLRIDVDQRGGAISKPISRTPLPTGSVTQNYYIPLDNPFVGQPNALEEFFCIGLRSPHRMTIDPATKRIFIGDVGLASWEEISVIEPNESALNFQWDRVEGKNGDLTPPYIGTNKSPIIHYSHSEGSAVIGGYVYRGSEFASDLGGKYIFGDNGSGVVWYLDESVTPPVKVPLCQLPNGGGPSSGSNYIGLSSFGVDEDNELYLCQMSSLGGRIYKLQRSGSPPVALPPTLSATGLFQAGTYGNNGPLQPVTGLVEFKTVNPLWSDNAYKYRWFGIPDGTQIAFSPTGEWAFPQGSVFLKHFDLPTDDNNPATARRLETRVLVRDDQGFVYGMTYKWRPDNSDADLITAGVTEDVPIIGNVDLGTLTSTDIGGAATGATLPFNGGWEVTGGGADIFGTSDQFRFVHTQKTGDFDIATRLESLDRADLYTKAGLMVRESLAANARNVMALVFPSNEARNNNNGGYEFQYRNSTAGGSAAIYPVAPQPQVRYPNAWLRLKRAGDVFTAYHSRDGKNWTVYATHTLALPSTVYFGMAVTGHSGAAQASARFHFNINRTQPWYYPGRQDCLACHTQPSGGVLGINPPQANSDYHYLASGITDNQLRALNHAGYFNPALNEADIPTYEKLAALSDSSASIEHRVRSYIDSNCAHCHRPGGVHAFWDGRIETPLAQAGIVNGIVQDALGIGGARAIVPQSVDQSIIYKRLATATEHYKMPPLAKALVDQDAIAAMEEWIGQVAQPPAEPLPSPWLHADIGNISLPGDATYATAADTFIMSGSGDDIWNGADAFHFAYQTLHGDGELIARVQSLTPTDPYTKAGVMIRESLDPGAKNAMTTLMSSQGTQLQYRDTTSGASVFIDGPNFAAPYYIRIRRQGDVITSFVAANSGAWVQIGTVTLPMASTAYVGLALTAHNNAQTATALFDHVQVLSSGLPLELHVNFQRASDPVPEGYVADSGAAFGARGSGFSYGWNVDNSAYARDRNAANAPDQRYDTLNHMKHTDAPAPRFWEVELPNGIYSVHVVSGDATAIDSHHVITAEGSILLDGTPDNTDRFIEATGIVTVADGRLTLAQGAGGTNTKLCYIDVQAVTGAVEVALTAPAHQSTHYGPAAAAVTLSADATTTSSGASIDKVEFYQGFTKLGEDTTAPYEYVWTTPPAGVHRIMARGIDSTGASGFSSFVDISVSADGAFGLEAEYWPNLTMTGAPLTRNDANIQFDWNTGVPMNGIPNDNFSARWRGRIKAQYSETYTFTTESDDGVRLWVDGQLLIDKWQNQGLIQHSGTIALVAGQTYEFEMHYFDNFGAAVAKLLWSSTSQTQQAVPGTQFFNTTPGTNHRPRTPDIVIPGVDGELTDPISIVMQSSAFEDVDATDVHAGTQWEIWSTDVVPVKVWSATVTTGPALTYAGLADGAFEVGFTALANDTSYRLRVRHQDDSADANSEWSPWAARLFTTTPPDDPRGVYAEYYAGTTRLSVTPAVSRTENNINYDYGNGAPPSTTTVGADNFSVRWRARVKPQFSETYTFTTETDDGARLWVNGQLLVDKWVGQGATPWSGQITLVAGQYYDLEMQYFDGAFGASAKLHWSSISQPQQIIPALRLYAISLTANHRPLAPLVATPAAEGSVQDAATMAMQSGAFEDQDVADTHAATDWEIWTDELTPTRIWSALNQTATERLNITLADGTFEGSHSGRTSLIGDGNYKLRLRHQDSSADANSEWGAWSEWRTFTAASAENPHGLAGEYYNNTQTFQGTPQERIDANVDFTTWGMGSPMLGIGTDNFTVRWRGRIKPEFSETYTFKTRSDDGARLWVNGQLIIDQFVYQGTVEHTGTITLVAGQYYDIELHYLEGGFDANVQLLWSSASRPEQVVPAGRLYLPLPGNNRRPRAPDIAAPIGTVSASVIAMQSGAFADLDAGQSHAATDWEIWTTAGAPERVWTASDRTGAQLLAIHLSQGIFENSLLGQSRLDWSTNYQIRVRHKDNSGSANDEWSAWTLKAFATSAPPWETWRTNEFTAGELSDPTLSGETADFDHDGLSNLLEYATRTSPKTPGVSPLTLSNVAAGLMQVTFPVNTSAGDVVLHVETSTQLLGGTWDSNGITYETVGAPAGGVQMYRATVPLPPGELRRFVRLVVTKE